MKRTILFGTAVLAYIGSSAVGRTIYVDDDGPADFNNIQAAIDDANHGDTVVVGDGKSENGPENCIIDCNGSETEPHCGFDFQNGDEEPNSVVDGFTIRNGYLRTGGAIYGRCTRATVTNCIITGNVAEVRGAGIAYFDGTISNCVIQGNSSIFGAG